MNVIKGIDTPSAQLNTERGESSLIDWGQFKFTDGQLSASGREGLVINRYLKNTGLSCTITGSSAGGWEVRKEFIEKVLEDIVTKCTEKDHPLVFISLGSDFLLMEYILGKTLLEQGFKNLSFFLVDPSYRYFKDQEHKQVIERALNDFTNKIKECYSNKYKEPLPEGRIKFLSRSQNITNHPSLFPEHANVVMIESLPPYGENIKNIHANSLIEKTPEELLAGNGYFLEERPNALSLVPEALKNVIVSSGGKLESFLPLAILKDSKTNSLYYVDWGCKIQPNGDYYLAFTGAKEYLQSLSISNLDIQKFQNLIDRMENAIREMLDKEIKQIKDQQEKLLPENIKAILAKVKDIASSRFPGLNCYFAADYTIDRAEALEFISARAGHTYRQRFCLEADPKTDYRITNHPII